jgi:hypothetical protein
MDNRIRAYFSQTMTKKTAADSGLRLRIHPDKWNSDVVNPSRCEIYSAEGCTTCPQPNADLDMDIDQA